ncbi:hypothetical protein [Enterovibrio baiacu]|uniref:hypothetical protein n=1 Tax=Enterovibrio baiacu TaxID=2491023 RepID=UPI00101078FC|nr:hypothetical protein [Enterovibrio baiacu]MBE1275099.1 hypothetical protein [Enterovibrio baiacu]
MTNEDYTEYSHLWDDAAVEEAVEAVEESEEGFDVNELMDSFDSSDEESEEFSEDDFEEGDEPEEPKANELDTLGVDDVVLIAGVELTKGELEKVVSRKNELTTAYEGLSGVARDLEANEEFLKERVVAVQTEADREIAAIKRKLQDPYISDAERGKFYMQLTNAETRRGIVEQEASAYTKRVQEFKAKELQERYNHMDHVMTSNHSDWKDIKEDIGKYLLNSGMPSQDAVKVLSPQFAEILVKAYKYDKTVKSSIASLNKQPEKQRATVAAPKKREKLTKQSSEALKNYAKGKASSRDMVDVFSFLED